MDPFSDFFPPDRTLICGFAKHLSGTRNDSCSNICKLGTSKGQGDPQCLSNRDPHGPMAYPLFFKASVIITVTIMTVGWTPTVICYSILIYVFFSIPQSIMVVVSYMANQSWIH